MKMIKNHYNLFDEIIFAMLTYVDLTEVSILKEYKITTLMNILCSSDSALFFDTYDEYYEDIDEQLKENNANFFGDMYQEQNDSFSCIGILDDDDLYDYDQLLK